MMMKSFGPSPSLKSSEANPLVSVIGKPFEHDDEILRVIVESIEQDDKSFGSSIRPSANHQISRCGRKSKILEYEEVKQSIKRVCARKMEAKVKKKTEERKKTLRSYKISSSSERLLGGGHGGLVRSWFKGLFGGGVTTDLWWWDSLLFPWHTGTMWDVYDEIKATGTVQSKQTNSVVIDGLCRLSKLQDAVSFLRETEAKGIGPSIVSLNTIMSRYCKLGFTDIAKSFFCMMLNDMKKHGVEPDMVTYNILTKGFRLHGQMDGAWILIQRMLDKGSNPDVVTYTILICGHCQNGNVKEGLKLREEMLSCGLRLSVLLYSVLFSSLCKIGQLHEALVLFYEMEEQDLEPDHVTYSILIHGFCKRGENGMILEARMYFDSLIMNDWADDIVLYNIMVDGYVRQGNLEEALELYKIITEKGITPTTVTFNSLIYGFCKNGNLAEARRLVETIRLHGLEPTVVTYTTLMNAYCEDGNMRCMLKLLQEMHAKGIRPTHVTCTVIIKGFCKQQKLQEAIRLLQDMCYMGLNPDQDANKLLISLHEQNIKMSKVAYTQIIKAHCVKGDVYSVFMFFRLMMEKGFEISIKYYSAVINRLCKRCLITVARPFFCILLSHGISPDQEICDVLFNAYRQCGDLTSVYEMLAWTIKSGLLPQE
ncbi:cell division cycle 20.1, cofactor of APC complex-like [Hibiscus syriacus]|uniref:Cell division cycle 20.1, cofactor of APC complex-like n=1 Tax=Hibiscus syriacus TaxID=106335 RepID=A0A6A2YPN9_HIBSY|nr:cell division cycle 20.1, cofactor of APC complex-like [Hibiscus syriacus]